MANRNRKNFKSLEAYEEYEERIDKIHMQVASMEARMGIVKEIVNFPFHVFTRKTPWNFFYHFEDSLSLIVLRMVNMTVDKHSPNRFNLNNLVDHFFAKNLTEERFEQYRSDRRKLDWDLKEFRKLKQELRNETIGHLSDRGANFSILQESSWDLERIESLYELFMSMFRVAQLDYGRLTTWGSHLKEHSITSVLVDFAKGSPLNARLENALEKDRIRGQQILNGLFGWERRFIEYSEWDSYVSKFKDQTSTKDLEVLREWRSKWDAEPF